VFRYVVLMWNGEAAGPQASARSMEDRLKSAAPGWDVVYARAGIKVLVADGSAALGAQRLFGHAGVVIGECFVYQSDACSDAPCRHAVFSARETQVVIDSRGRALIDRYWGNYVALVVDAPLVDGRTARARTDDGSWLVTGPTGTLPCYLSQSEGVHVVFSCLCDCHDLGMREFSVNKEFLARHAVNGAFDAACEPYGEISTVRRGECVRFDTRGKVLGRNSYWSPSSFVGSAELIEDADCAERALRATLRSCVHSFAAHHSRVLQETSGGLDSSIVLGCLGEAPNVPDITCYTNYVPDAPSDERRWARYAAARGGHRHAEVSCTPGELDFKHMPALRPSVEPASCMWHWQKGATERRLVAEHPATAAFSGDGGDAVFCSTCYVFAVDHCLRRYGLGRRTWRTAALVAMRRDRTVWNMLGKAISRRVCGTPMEAHRQMMAPGLRLVDTQTRKAVEAETQFPNPWFGAERGGVSLEMISRLGMLAFAPNFYDLSISHHANSLYAIAPLCAQPVVELCQRIPVDIHFDAGRTRGLARRAFTHEVPAPILRRQWKDRPPSQLTQVVQRNLRFLQETLLDGILVKERILDREAVDTALAGGPTKSRATNEEILRHLDLELWARNGLGAPGQ
jgi:asparagine synthase (glutamine-hydrolysing)